MEERGGSEVEERGGSEVEVRWKRGNIGWEKVSGKETLRR